MFIKRGRLSLFSSYMTADTDELLTSAKRRLLVADHFLTQTYPLLQDPKLLVSVLEGLLCSIEEMVDAVLVYERNAGLIPAYGENFPAKLSVLKGDLAKKYGLTHVDVAMLSDMQELLLEHKKSDVEFPRKGAYIMASKDFSLSTVTLEKLKTYLTRSKTLYTKIHDCLTRN